MPVAFHKSSFFLNYSTLLYHGDKMQWLSVNCFSVRVSKVLLLCSKKYVDNVHTKQKKGRSAGEVFALLKVGHVLTPVMLCATAWISISCSLVKDETVVVMIKCFAPLSVGHVQTPFL